MYTLSVGARALYEDMPEVHNLKPRTRVDVMYRALAKPSETVEELLDAEVEVQWFQKGLFESCNWVH